MKCKLLVLKAQRNTRKTKETSATGKNQLIKFTELNKLEGHEEKHFKQGSSKSFASVKSQITQNVVLKRISIKKG